MINMTLPKKVTIVEVGARDGLQNEPKLIDTQTKIEFINRLSDTGLAVIEATSLVNPAWVPQLADAEEVFRSITRHEDIVYPVLVPNLYGMERAVAMGVKTVAIFTSASEAFNQRNINCSIDESFERFKPAIELARSNDIKVRGYLSCVMGCPYQGKVDVHIVTTLAERLYQLGCYEISLGDTIGIGTPLQAQQLITEVGKQVALEHLAIHFHDTRGQALANILACLQLGVSVVDASVAGLGGCPYASGASGNVATEDLVYMLHGMGISTHIDLEKLLEAGTFICQKLGRENQSKLGRISIQ